MRLPIAPDITMAALSGAYGDGSARPPEAEETVDSAADAGTSANPGAAATAETVANPDASPGTSEAPAQPIVAGSEDTFQQMSGQIQMLAELLDKASGERSRMNEEVHTLRGRAYSVEVQLGRAREQLERERGIRNANTRTLRASVLSRVELDKAAASSRAALQRVRAGARKADDEIKGLSSAMGESQKRAMEASRLISGALHAMSPLLGSESPLAKMLAQGAELLDGAIILYANANEKLAAARGELAPARDDVSSHTVPESLNDVTALIFTNMELRLALAFPDASAEELQEKSQTLRDAIGIILSRRSIGNAGDLVDRALATLLEPETQDFEVRGSVHELIRLAHLLRAGRKIEDVSVVFPDVEIHGWSFNRSEGRICRQRMCNDMEIDARGEGALIEMKAIRLGSFICRILEAMLNGDEEAASRIIESGDGARTELILHAIKLANQLLRYRDAIARGIGHSMELHITSSDSPPLFLVQAIHRFFDRSKVRVVWYEDVLDAKGHLLDADEVSVDQGSPAPSNEPQESVATAPQPEPAAQEAATQTPSSEPPPASAVPEPQDAVAPPAPSEPLPQAAAEPEPKRSSPPPRKRVKTPSAAPTSSPPKAKSSQPAPAPAPEADEEARRRESALRELVTAASQAVYQSSLPAQVNYNTSILEPFIAWLVNQGHWSTKLSTLGSQSFDSEIVRLHEVWSAQQAEDRANATNGNGPWSVIRDQRAEKRFNDKSQETVGKQPLDWSQRNTKGIQNVDVITMLSSLQDNQKVKADPGLNEAIGQYIAYLRQRYKLNAYFKTAEDGPRLRDIVKRYMWTVEGARS